MDKGNLHNGVLLKCKNNDIMRFEGESEKETSELGNPNSERQALYVLTQKHIVDVT